MVDLLFAGTRVTIKANFNCLLACDDQGEFLDNNACETREQAIGILGAARETVIDDNEAAA